MSNSKQSTSGVKKPIGKTLLFNLSLIAGLAVVLLFFVVDQTVRQSFDELEQVEIAKYEARLQSFKNKRLKDLQALAYDWGVWDDAYNFVQDFNSEFIATNLEYDTLVNLQIDAFVVSRYSDGQAVKNAFVRETGEYDTELADQLNTYAKKQAFVDRLVKGQELSNFISINGEVYALTAIQINNGAETAVPPGFLVLASRMESARANEALQAEISFVASDKDIRTSVQKLDGIIEVTSPFVNEEQASIGHVTMTLPRPLVAAADKLVLLAVVATVAVVILMLVILQWRVRHLVLSPIEGLHNHLRLVRQTGDLRTFDNSVREDEFGAAHEEFNQMAQELQSLRSKLEAQSFDLGRSQNAIGLMHNLRNCLSPVKIILETLERKVNTPFPPQTARALDELRKADIDDSRRSKLVDFVEAVHDQRLARDAENQLVVRDGARGLLTAFEAIDTVQNSEGVSNQNERCELSNILSHSRKTIQFADGLNIIAELSGDAEAIVKGSRVLIAQVVDNLVVNAIEAIRKAGRNDGTIQIKTSVSYREARCRLTVTDDGVGFLPEASQRLFERDYSTRDGNAGGLGLHWCANTIRAMGGEMSITSAGPNTGATAIVSLPLYDESKELTDEVA